jgi:hypothetical protein
MLAIYWTDTARRPQHFFFWWWWWWEGGDSLTKIILRKGPMTETILKRLDLSGLPRIETRIDLSEE